MTENSLDRFVAAVRADWRPISTALVAQCRAHLDALTLGHENEEWLASLIAERPATRELHREPGSFMLLAHAERQDLYRPPHDHGRAWVVYAVQSGALEIGTYGRVGERLVRRETIVLRPGEARAYLPGDIHDTRCLTEEALVFRFTERDLRREDQVEGRVTRFVAREGEWFVPGA
ncbi:MULTISPECIES: hypothetical protein [unclassified Sphingomonas]|uniref:hypothetical protein n=1 Tax=unclassified Sphingomonas TaxID=196159 RepID=UPI0006F6F6D1|nr:MULTISPECIES: hypothetical protein [unclassified Sphingomonas]KQX22600.1 hypothetical protein ASD17_04680 [Sphingomonas sp. Root1294]KQY67922.1 hypothetical protein ASD39_08450 [Sphingomonas sp. Root50]KRB88846.1 hypothetical protein ASE22_20800 [Sphingomonas sp. Root720]